ncbi:hypothetical protein F4808DRAFT_461493 [Astrocystis sublimbata]|nr:hypothetical protein F4808DRAFT_461493 [Astrocystis sublimbata]
MALRAATRSLCVYGLFVNLVLSLGINCRGSGLCPRASWNNIADVSIIQLLRDAVYAAPAPLSTSYKSGDHVICVSQTQKITIEAGFDFHGLGGSIGLSGSIGEGGICLFPQYMADGATLSLEQIRPLVDAILEHKCTTCGSVPIHFIDEGSNDPSDGILTFNYVAAPFCDGNCISAVGGSGSSSSNSAAADPSTTTVFVVVGSSTSAEEMTQPTDTSAPYTTTVFVVVDSSTASSSMTEATSDAITGSDSPTPTGNNGQVTRVPMLIMLVAAIGLSSMLSIV